MAVHFSKAFNLGQGSITFYFNRLHTPEGVRYHVSTVGRNNKAIIFHMAPRLNSNRWVLVEKESLGWLADLEEELSDAISRHIALSKKSKAGES